MKFIPVSHYIKSGIGVIAYSLTLFLSQTGIIFITPDIILQHILNALINKVQYKIFYIF